MRILRLFLMLSLVASLPACSKFARYHGPEVTRVLVYKEQRTMYLMHNDRALKKYDIGLGFAPAGNKETQGDGRTPEGDYTVNRRNPNSEFYLSLGISYPDNNDRLSAREAGVDPGGDIFIHGRPKKYSKGGRDWTAGCIAVTNQEIRRMYAMVKNGTPISIYP